MASKLTLRLQAQLPFRKDLRVLGVGQDIAVDWRANGLLFAPISGTFVGLCRARCLSREEKALHALYA